jgi:hypothetical protein
MGELWAGWLGLKEILGLDFLKGGSEKGSTRKDTGIRVTRWKKLFWRNLRDSR